jgi:DNA-binding XRE family transcriptional regulator
VTDVFEELKGLIRRSGMSYWNVAHKAGCTERTISNWMTGRVMEPRLSNAIAVAALFGKTIELTNGELRIVPDTPASVAAKLNQAREFVGYWRRWQ